MIMIARKLLGRMRIGGGGGGGGGGLPLLVEKLRNRNEDNEIHTSCFVSINEKDDDKSKESKYLMHPFEYAKKKEKETFLECLRKYESRSDPKHDHLQFIKVAMKYMDQFGVNKDLETYKLIIDIFPKGKMVPKNAFQVILFHYPKDQFLATELLGKMEENGVCPDPEVEVMLKNVFGKFGHPLMKLYAMQYWFPKFKNLTPWPVPKPLPNDTLELAKAIIQRITSADLRSKVMTYNSEDVKDSIEKTWIVSGSSPTQGELLKKHDKKKAIFVEGPFLTWLGDKSLEYFILKGKPPPRGYLYPDYDPDDVARIRIPHLEVDYSAVILPPSVHEQEEGIIFAICATGTSTKDSLLSWIRCLEKDYPILEEIPIVFTLKKSSAEKLYIADSVDDQIRRLEEKNDASKSDDR